MRRCRSAATLVWILALSGASCGAPPASSPSPATEPTAAPFPAGQADATGHASLLDGGPPSRGRNWSLSWEPAPSLTAPHGDFAVTLGGTVQADGGAADGDRLEREIDQEFDQDTYWRRLRLNVTGQFLQRVEFKAEGSFAARPYTVTDLYLRLTDLPGLGTLTAGHFKEPMGLEQLAGSVHTTFMERSLVSRFTGERNFGLMARKEFSDHLGTWAAGVFRTTSHRTWGSSGTGDSWDVTGRVTRLVFHEDEGRRLLHLGASYGLRRPEEPVRFSSRPETYFLPVLTDTKKIDADLVHRLGLEAAWVQGPLSLQAEYAAAACDASQVGNPWLHGLYAQASYVLTGESRSYDRATGVFKGITPRRSLGQDGGLGAWEAAARCSFLDLDKGGLPADARTLTDITVGLNWYLCPNVRIAWNYIHAWADGRGVDAGADIAMMRLQVTF